MRRRTFLKHAGVATGVTASHSLTGASQRVSLIVDPRDPIASSAPPGWAVRELRAALEARGVAAQIYPRPSEAPTGDRRVIIAGGNSSSARQILKGAGVS